MSIFTSRKIRRAGMRHTVAVAKFGEGEVRLPRAEESKGRKKIRILKGKK
jgi:hypothetical protein